MRMRRLPLLAAAAGILVCSGGCAITSRVPQPKGEPTAPEPATESASPPGGRPDLTVRYSTGRAMEDFPFPTGAVASAVLEAMDDLKITVHRRGRDGPVAQIEGRTPDNRAVTVTLRHQKPVTHLSCRVGWFGDEPYSRALLRRIAVRLGMLPPEAIPDVVPSAPSPNPYFSRSAVSDEEMMRDFVEAPYRSRPDM